MQQGTDAGVSAAIIAAIPEPFFVFDEEGRYVQIIGCADRVKYHAGDHLVGKRIHDVITAELADEFVAQIKETLAAGEVRNYVYRLSATDIKGSEHLPGPAGKQWFEAHISPVAAHGDAMRLVVWVAFNITERQQILREKDALIGQLQAASQEIKTLRGILPICSHCKKIRDSNGCWNQLEAYLHAHFETDLSHSICPDCRATFYAGFISEDN